ncbi:DUF1801 domain-containing protein [Yoonia sp. MH D7]
MDNAADIVTTVKNIVRDIAPSVRFVRKYGGEVFCTEPDNDKVFVGGIFENKAHVSLEFSEGASLKDPSGHLEGTGKHRRHLKFRSLSDIVDKDTKSLLARAFALYI